LLQVSLYTVYVISLKMVKNVNQKLTKASTPATPALPSPFRAAPSDLEPFTSCLNKSSVYITHFDHHPRRFKQRIFAVPVLLNFAIFMGLIWRLYLVIPWYFQLLASFSQGPILIEQRFNQWVALAILRRLLTFVIDYFLIKIVWPWPIGFFLEQPDNPMSWRLKCGFKDKEAIVRVSRNWGRDDLMGGAKKGAESPFFKTRLLPALVPQRMEKTGYLLMDGNWDLDFGLMVFATRLLTKSTLKEAQLDRKVFAWVGSSDESGQWAVWDEKGFAQDTQEHVEELEEASNTENREKIYKIQSKMQQMGKEELFYKWVELIQYESTRPGGFTQERQLEAGMKVQALFEEHGVDFAEFEKSVGGMQ
jgi:hypothetical protein